LLARSSFVVLTGGTGGAKFVDGLARVIPPRQLTIVVNTGDDLIWWGLHVSPDLDSVTYALAGLTSRQRGWGVEGDTFNCLDQMRRMDEPVWFQLGDRDLALHLTRTGLLREGRTLTEATAAITRKLGVRARILPMSDSRVQTRVRTSMGELSFQEYFVRERYKPRVEAVWFQGSDAARPAPGVCEAIAEAAAVFIAPSNPVTSIRPILAVPGVLEALHTTPAPVVAVTPIVAGAAVSGPAGELMQSAGLEVSIAGVARTYSDFLDVLVADEQDRNSTDAASAVNIVFTNTIMKTEEDRAQLAQAALAAVPQGKKRRRSSI
jgi:LPPG:FO 2-phospho-L-lactate transferase